MIPSMIGNPWNPMPGWLHPGLADDPVAPVNTPWNRGAFDANGLPYMFRGLGTGLPGYADGELYVRRLQTTGQSGIIADMFIRRMRDQYGDEGVKIAQRFLRDQFCHDRNGSYSVPDPFWSPSPQTHVVYESPSFILMANVNKPPGFVPVEPPEGDSPYKPEPWPTEGDDLRRWSCWPKDYPKKEPGTDTWKKYPLWQSRDAGQTDEQSNMVYRARVFPMTRMMLEGLTEFNYANRLFFEAVNP